VLTIALTMIVRDEAGHLPRCLDSVAGLFDELVIVDTGSTDRTREIARDLGAKVFGFEWCDDFAAARNAALDLATADLAMWLDADEFIEPAHRPRLRAVLAHARRSSPAAFAMFQRSVIREPGREAAEWTVPHVRLFPRRPDVRWAGRVHEDITPAVERAGLDLVATDLVIRHTGFSDPATYAARSERNRRIDADAAVPRYLPIHIEE
jgi:glycosyltransferase involved in cell wall biosynthesis